MSYRKLDQGQVEGLQVRFEGAESRLTAAEDRLDGHDTSLSDEATARENADTALTNALNAEISRASDAEDALQSAIDAEVTARGQDVDAEQARAEAAESALDTKIDTTKSDLQDEIDADVSAAVAALVNQASEEYNTLGELEGKIKVEEGRIDALLDGSSVDFDTLIEIVNAYQLADTDIVTSITGLQTALDAEIASTDGEVQALQQVDVGLQSAIESEAARAVDKENEIAGNLGVESQRAQAAETALQGNIDSLSSSVDGFFGDIEDHREFWSKEDFVSVTEGQVTYLKSPAMGPMPAGKREYVTFVSVNGVTLSEKEGFNPADGFSSDSTEDYGFITEQDGSVYLVIKADYSQMDWDMMVKSLRGPQGSE